MLLMLDVLISNECYSGCTRAHVIECGSYVSFDSFITGWSRSSFVTMLRWYGCLCITASQKGHIGSRSHPSATLSAKRLGWITVKRLRRGVYKQPGHPNTTVITTKSSSLASASFLRCSRLPRQM